MFNRTIFGLRNRAKDDSPCGVLISTQAEYNPQGVTPRGERKDLPASSQAGAKDAKFGHKGLWILVFDLIKPSNKGLRVQVLHSIMACLERFNLLHYEVCIALL